MTFTPALLLLAGGMETMLLLTSLLTVVAIALILVILLIPEPDRKRYTEAWSRVRRYLLTGTHVENLETNHNYDGIRELDNRIPPWFSTLFIGTIIWGAVYLLNYHVFGSLPLSTEEYNEEISAADLHRRILLASEGQIDEKTLVALKDPAALKRGGENFQKYCISCHGPQGGGIVGPNLTDEYWIHGGGIVNVFTTIKTGVPAKGMISWQLVFTPKQMHEIGSYVLSLQGTNPPGGKKPEGQKWVEPDTTKATATL